jgi:hypothetical protein
MALIIKNSGKKKSDQRQIYTWAACILVSVFLISVAVPMMGGGKKRESKYKETFMDLAAMPFASDAAEAELLASAQYQDIAKADLINTLFSKKDKEARQAEDGALGVPPPPDEEYKEAEIQKQVVSRAQNRASKYTSRASAKPVAPTVAGSLRGGSGVSGGGGASSRTTGTIWSSTEKISPKNPQAAGQLKAGLIDDLKKGGRGGGFMNAYEKSAEAAKNKDNESAANTAASAFQDGQGGKGDLDSELEKAAKELGGDSVDPEKLKGAASNINESDKLDDALKDGKDRGDQQLKDACEGSIFSGGFKLNCLLSALGEAAVKGAADAITGGMKNMWTRGDGSAFSKDIKACKKDNKTWSITSGKFSCS